jgi:anti-sigma factor RsiW
MSDMPDLTDLVDGTLSGPEWDAWLAERPAIAAEVALARRVSALIAELRAAEVALPAGFEARLLARARADTTVLDLFDLGFGALGRAIIELLEALLGIAPAPQPGATQTA